MTRREPSRRIGYVLAALGLGMMGFGAARGEMAVVLAKAVKICLECVGIG